jgi:hypothetical protein
LVINIVRTVTVKEKPDARDVDWMSSTGGKISMMASALLPALYVEDDTDGHALRRRNRCEIRRWNLVFADFHVFSNRVGKLVVFTAILNM